MKSLNYYSFNDVISRLYKPFNEEEALNKIQTPNITFQITDDCNLCCSYCYQINKGHHVMPFEIAKEFIDLLIKNDSNTFQYLDTTSCKAVILEFIGGEPLLYPELMDQIIQYFIKRTIEENHPWQYLWRITVSSNGTLYFNENVQKFLNKYADKLSFSISIDGNKQLHDACRVFKNGQGSYDIAIEASRHYRNVLHRHLGSKVTLSPFNITYTFEAIKNLIEEGYTEIFANCVFEKGWTLDHARIFYLQLKQISDYILDNDLDKDIFISLFNQEYFKPKSLEDTNNWCGGNGAMIAIDWKGDIYPCLRYMESSLGPDIPPIKLGNVKTGILTTEKCKNCIFALKQVNRINQSTQECLECPIAEGCSWCQAYNYQISGDFKHRATFICIMHKAQSLANVYYWNKYYQKNNIDKKFQRNLSDEDCLQIISNDELQLLKTLEQEG